MLATKNRALVNFVIAVLFAVGLAGCMPPGPRALLDGRRLLDEGLYPEAVEKFKTATQLMPTNAPAWNYLGLAYHRIGQPTNAVVAYTRALALNRDLVEARYNLGAVLLEENKLELAKSEFTAYTLRRSNAVEGWLKLGAVQLRLRDPAGAEKSFREALRVNVQNVEALNGLGLVFLQQSRPRDAAQQFAGAVKLQPDYAPALLNLATVSQQYLKDRTEALQRYHEYLALKPRPENWEAVSAVVKSLEQPLAIPPVAPPRAAATNALAPVAINTNISKPPGVAANRTVTPARTEPPPAPTKSAPAASMSGSTATVQVVKLPPEPVIKTTTTDAPTRVTASTSLSVANPSTTAPAVARDEAKPAHRGFLSRINPANLFREDTKSAPTISADPITAIAQNPLPEIAVAPPTANRGPATRYMYLNPAKPAQGNRSEAARAFAQGQQAQRGSKLTEAMNSYRQATQVDPAYYEAYYNLGLTAYAARSYRLAMAAWEYALALQPDSVDARYNFTLALKAANHPVDAADEAEKILAANPDEVRAHLILGNLYAEQLSDPARARIHYTRLLELSPRHPQAAAIRYWIVANPP